MNWKQKAVLALGVAAFVFFGVLFAFHVSRFAVVALEWSGTVMVTGITWELVAPKPRGAA